MDKMRKIAGNGALMPRFNDGMANMAELIRVMTESLVNEIMDTWSDEARESCNRRNGYRERRLATDVDTITLGIPKLRAGNHFPDDLVERFSRVDRAVIAAVSEMVTNGVSTRKVKRVAQSMGTDHMSAGQVSRMCSSLDESIADLQERDLPDVIRPYPGATWQRCIVHLMRNAAGNAPTRQKKGAVLGILKAVFAERDPELVREFHRLATDRIEGFCPKAAEAPEDAEADAVLPGFPLRAPRRAVHQQRAGSRRQRAQAPQPRRAGLPSRRSLIKMMGAIFSEMDEG